MFSYVAVAWNVHSETQTRFLSVLDARMHGDSRQWSVALEAPGFIIYCSGLRAGSSDIYPLSEGRGVILGTVFSRRTCSDGTPNKASFGTPETTRILITKGRSLADDYWGRYVAFFTSDQTSSAWVMRSPTGELDCLSTEIDGVTVYFSAAEHCPLLALRRFSINWAYVAADLATLIPDTRETGILEIQRILRGECVTMRADRIERISHWHPFQFVNDPIESPAFAIDELRRTGAECVNAWASCYASIVPMLSGGLDSSIVVGLLRRSTSNPRVVCLNYCNPYDPISDERRYAQLVAERNSYPLIEHEQSAEFSLQPMMDMPRAVSPYLSIFGLGDVQRFSRLAREHEAGAWFLGHGGDEVFFKGAAQYNCADFAHRYGLRPGLFSVALSEARMSGRALWSVLRTGLRDGLRRNSLTPALRQYRLLPLLNVDVLRTVLQQQLFIPSWFESHVRIPPGKCVQVIGLSVTDAMHRAFAPEDDPELVNPLKAQPMQELCLRVPTHLLAYRGRSRGLARSAFADVLPAEIARRRTKGGVHDYIKAVWALNVAFVTELLRTGVLVQEGIIDRVQLDEAISKTLKGHYADAHHLSSLACAEAWARRWSETEGHVLRMTA